MADLQQLIGGFQISQALYVLATLGIPDLLADGPRSSDDLAAASGADPDALHRLVRALARVGVLEEVDGKVALTELGSLLRTDARGSLHAYAAHVGKPYHWNAWSELLRAVQTGEPSFPHVHGQSAWAYRAAHPEERELFDAWMVAKTQRMNAAVLDAYDFGRFRHVVDVGGGRGALLRAILARHPNVRGTLFDQDHVVAGIDDLDTVAGSFFDAVPGGAEAYVLKSVIHDWDDDHSVSILRVCAAAMADAATLLLVEADLDRDPAAPWLDLQMLVMLGGRERTEDEYAALFEAAGLAYVGKVAAEAGVALFEARR